MNKTLKIAVSPHIHGGRSTAGIMRDVLIALFPAAVAGTVIFGLRALLVLAICTASCVGFELFFNLITKKDLTVTDLSAAVTGLLLGLNLPANVPLWQCVVGSLFAIVVVKCLFGGLGKNIANPAIAARVFMLLTFGAVGAVALPQIVEITGVKKSAHQYNGKWYDDFSVDAKLAQGNAEAVIFEQVELGNDDDLPFA